MTNSNTRDQHSSTISPGAPPGAGSSPAPERARHTTSDACRGCGACVDVCPNQVLAVIDGRAHTVAVHASRCIRCGGCAAVCPNGALLLDGFSPEDFPLLGEARAGYDALLALLGSRRSIRRFRDRPVERAVLEQVLAAAATAPMGFPPHTTEVLILDRRDELDHLSRVLRRDYAQLVKAYRNPLVRPVIRLSAGAEDFHALKTHVIAIAEDANARFNQSGEDRYTYEAPALLLFHAHRWQVSYRTNAVIVATHAMIAAQALGLGTTMLDIVAPIVNRSPELKQRWAIPKDNVAVIAMVLGYPKYKYARGVRRALKGIR